MTSEMVLFLNVLPLLEEQPYTNRAEQTKERGKHDSSGLPAAHARRHHGHPLTFALPGSS